MERSEESPVGELENAGSLGFGEEPEEGALATGEGIGIGGFFLRLLAGVMVLAGLYLSITFWVGYYYTRKSYFVHQLADKIEWLRRAVAINPAEGNAWWQLVNAYLSAKNLDAAEEGLKQAERTFNRYETFFQRAQITYARAVHDAAVRYRAREVFDKTLRVNPGDINVLNQAAAVELLNHKPRLALQYVKQADRLNPVHKKTLQINAQVAAELGDYDTARTQFERLLILDPNNIEVRKALGKLLLEHYGERRRAYELLRRGMGPNVDLDYCQLLAPLAIEFNDTPLAYDIIMRLDTLQRNRPISDPAIDQLRERLARIFK